MDFDDGKLVVRKASERELYSVTVMTRRFFPYTGFNMEKIYKRLGSKKIHYFVALYGGHTVGFVDFKDNLASVRVMGLAVLEEFRGRGIGQALLDQALAFARRHGKKSVVLLVAQENETASRLYAKNGFARKGRLAQKIWGMDVVVMEKRLNGEEGGAGTRANGGNGFAHRQDGVNGARKSNLKARKEN